MPKRVARELRWRVGRLPARLDYKPLQPNLDEYLVSDSDAWASIDPHAALVFLISRGYDVLSHPGFLRRLTSKHEAVRARKPPRPSSL